METKTNQEAEAEADNGVYFNYESRLKQVVNSRATEENILNFISVLQDLKQINKAVNKPTDKSLSYSLSREYLKNLVIGKPKQKSNKIIKLLNKANIKTEVSFRYTTKRNGYSSVKSKEKINKLLL
jgi:hypothetical protein